MNLRRRADRERDMREELESLATLARENGDARSLGNLTRAAEEAREVWGWMWLERLFQDLRYAARALATQPAFAAVSVLMLALGIGATTTVFTAAMTVFANPLAVRNHASLRLLSWTSSKRAFGGRFLMQPMWDAFILNRGEGLKYFPYPLYVNLRDHAKSFASLACARPGPPVNLPDGRSAGIQAVSGNFFSTLGVDAVIGRTITPDDDRPGALPAVVIGYHVWRNNFGGDPAILSRTLKFGNGDVPIAGVLPENFFGLDPAFQYGVTMAIQPALARAKPPVLTDSHNWNGCQAVLGVLRPGASEEQGRAESEALVRNAIAADPPREPWDAPRMLVTDLGLGFSTLRKAAAQPLRLLMTAAVLVLLIACANLAGLLLARGAARQKEIATRLALGASRARVVRQLLTESLLLAVLGGAAGAAVAWLLIPLLPMMFQQFNHYQFDNLGARFHADARVVAFAGLLAVVTTFLFGLAPALHAVRRGLTAPRGIRFASGKVLSLALQVAISMVLLTGAGLLLRTVRNLESVPMGYDAQGLLYFTADTPANRQAFVSRVSESLRTLPGVSSAAVSIWPIFTSAPDTYLQVCMHGDRPASFDDRFADSDFILPGFFETWRVPFVRGRDFRPGEGADNIIVNNAFVRRYLGKGDDPLGRTVSLGMKCTPATIVGVVADSTDRPRIVPRPFVYRPYNYQPTQLTFAVRTPGDAAALMAPIEHIVAGLGTHVFDPVTTGTLYRARTMGQERLFSALLTAFGGLALFIACVGIYGMTMYTVRRRTPEIGIRMSLGARRPDAVRLVLAETVAPVAAGIVAGVGAALALGKVVESVLFGVSRADPAALAGSMVLLLAITVVGAAMPARRACKIDPMRALRHL